MESRAASATSASTVHSTALWKTWKSTRSTSPHHPPMVARCHLIPTLLSSRPALMWNSPQSTISATRSWTGPTLPARRFRTLPNSPIQWRQMPNLPPTSRSSTPMSSCSEWPAAPTITRCSPLPPVRWSTASACMRRAQQWLSQPSPTPSSSLQAGMTARLQAKSRWPWMVTSHWPPTSTLLTT